MKHLSFLNLILVFGLLSIFIISCEDEDNVAPTIRLLADKNGDIDKVYVVLNEDWQDPGYTADDNTDKDLTSSVKEDISDLDMDKEGEYIIVYSVSDAAGNKTKKERTVIVRNAMYQFAGKWEVKKTVDGVDTNGDYEQTLSMSATLNNVVRWSNFSNINDTQTSSDGTVISIKNIKIDMQTNFKQDSVWLPTTIDENENEDWLKEPGSLDEEEEKQYWFRNGENAFGKLDSIENDVPRIVLHYEYKHAGRKYQVKETFKKKLGE